MGAGIYCNKGEVNIYGSVIRNNQASGSTSAQGTFYHLYCDLNLHNSTVDNNSARNNIFYMSYSNVVITNSIISNNNVATYVDGLGLESVIEVRYGESTLVLREVSFTNNTIPSDAHDIFISPNTITSTIVNTDTISKVSGGTHKTCSDNPCVAPYTGACSAVDASNSKLGVTCALASDYVPSQNTCGTCSLATRESSDTCKIYVTDVAGASKSSCYMDIDGMIFCMGNNEYGQLGNGVTSNTDTLLPTAVTMPAGLTAKQISMSDTQFMDNACAVMSDDNIYCWGANTHGELGDGTSGNTAHKNVPTAATMPNGLKAKTINTEGFDHTCAIMSDDNIYCWGEGNYGQLGHGTNADKNIPTAVTMPTVNSNPLTAKQVVTQYRLTCGIMSDDNIYCMGRNYDGQLGIGSTDTQLTKLLPTMVTMPTVNGNPLTAKQIALYTYGGCGILSDDKVYCWGPNYYGQLGIGSTDTSIKQYVPGIVTMPAGLLAKQVATAQSAVCAIMSDDNIYCWGRGLGGGADHDVPTAITMPSGLKAKYIDAGVMYFCAIMDDDSLYCFGENDNGQLGIDSTVDQSTFQKVQITAKTWIADTWTSSIWTAGTWNSDLGSAYAYGDETAATGGTSEERSVASSCDGVPANKIFDRTWVPDTWTSRQWTAGTWTDRTWTSEWGSVVAQNIGVGVKQKTCSVDANSGNFDGTAGDCGGTITDSIANTHFSSERVYSFVEPIGCSGTCGSIQRTSTCDATLVNNEEISLTTYDMAKLNKLSNPDVDLSSLTVSSISGEADIFKSALAKAGTAAGDCDFAGQFIKTATEVYVCKSATEWVKVSN